MTKAKALFSLDAKQLNDLRRYTERVNFSLDKNLLSELRRHKNKPGILADHIGCMKHITLSGIVAEGLVKELERRKARITIRHLVPAELAKNRRAMWYFRDFLLRDLQAIDLDVFIEFDANQIIVEAPAFCEAEMKTVLGGANVKYIEDALFAGVEQEKGEDHAAAQRA